MSPILPLLLLVVGQASPEKTTLEAELEKKEKEVLGVLRDEALWKNESKQKELLKCLREAKVVRSVALAPTLVKHIDYTHQSAIAIGLMPNEVRYPAYAALIATGVSAVQPLLDELRLASPDDTKNNPKLKQYLIVSCIVNIYKVGGLGKAMARARIEGELEKLTDEKAKKIYQDVLKDAYFKE